MAGEQTLEAEFQPATVTEVNLVVRSLKNSRSKNNVVPVTIYKRLSDLINPIICDIFNESVTQGVFPESLEIAKIIPVHKSGCRKKIENYRPISLLPTLSKIFEKLMHSRLYNYFCATNFFNDSQFGFLPKLGINDAIVS